MKSLIALGAFGLLCAAATGCSSGTPSLATTGPQEWAVSAGSSSANQALQALRFYPSSIAVDAGDTVVWTSPTAEVHSISIPVPGQTAPPASDPSAPTVVGGSTYDGTSYISSGFIAGGAKYSVKFTTPGTYTYFSIPQGFVSGTVVVQQAGAPYPKLQARYASEATSAIDSDIAAGISPTGATPANSSVMRFMNGPTEVDNLNVTISAGTSLTFTNLSNNVPHTVTFPAVGQQPPSGPPSQPAVGGNTYNGTSLVNSGVIPPGGTFTLTFTAPGTFKYYCLFHDDDEGMVGTVTVNP